MRTVGSDDRGLRFWHRKTVKLQAIHRLWCSWSFWAVHDLTTVDITQLLIQKCCAVFATKNLLELGGDECDNLNFMNFKIDSFKIRKNSWLLGTFKIQKIRILNLCMGLSRTISEINKDFSRKKIRFFPPRVFCAPTEGVHWNWVGLSAHLGQKTTIIGLPG